MFIFNAHVNLNGKIAEDNKSILFTDVNRESLKLEFKYLEEINIEDISSVQQPVFEDLKKEVTDCIIQQHINASSIRPRSGRRRLAEELNQPDTSYIRRTS